MPQEGAKQKTRDTDENEQMRIAAQGLDTIAQIRLASNGNHSPATPQMYPQKQQMRQAHPGSGQEVNGQPPRSGTTFVVNASKYKNIVKSRPEKADHPP